MTNKSKVTYIEVESMISVPVDDIRKEKWRHLCNEAYTGKKTIPLSEPIPQNLKDVHWYINCDRRVKIRLRLYSDGSLEVLPKPIFCKSTIPIPND